MAALKLWCVAYTPYGANIALTQLLLQQRYKGVMDEYDCWL